eukprot:ctg_542.g258
MPPRRTLPSGCASNACSRRDGWPPPPPPPRCTASWERFTSSVSA